MSHGLTILAIDGPCCSGKTTYARQLAGQQDCNVFHMDDFFLRPEQRTVQRYATPGGNVDYERFQEEVLVPLQEGRPFSYWPFCCATMTLGEPVYVQPKQLNIVEGTYSMHPVLRTFYTETVFLEIMPEEQLRRLRERESPESLQYFLSRWLPLEKLYFETFKPWTFCDRVFSF